MRSDGGAKTDEALSPGLRSIYSSQTFSHRQTASPSSAMSESGFGLVGCSRQTRYPPSCHAGVQVRLSTGMASLTMRDNSESSAKDSQPLSARPIPLSAVSAPRLDLNDEIDLAVQTLTGGLCYKFRGDESAGSAKAIWQALERLRAVFSRRGQRNILGPEAIGRVLRHFFMALQAGDEKEAEERYAQLREHYFLDGVNLLFLRVQLLEAFGRWNELLSLSGVGRPLASETPVAVTEALLRAVYRETLARFEDPADPAGAVAAFRSEVFPRYAALFSARAGMKSADVVKAYMLLAVSSDPPLRHSETNCSLSPEPRKRSDLSRFSRANSSRAPCQSRRSRMIPSLAQRRRPLPMTMTGRLALYARRHRRSRLLGILCECALELDNLETRAVAIEMVRALDDSARATFLHGRVHRHLWDQLQGAPSEPSTAATLDTVPTDWGSWLEYVDHHDGAKASRELARQGAAQWTVSDLLDRTDSTRMLVDRLRGVDSQAAERRPEGFSPAPHRLLSPRPWVAERGISRSLSLPP